MGSKIVIFTHNIYSSGCFGLRLTLSKNSSCPVLFLVGHFPILEMKEATLIALLTCHRLCRKFLINELATYVCATYFACQLKTMAIELGMHFPSYPLVMGYGLWMAVIFEGRTA